MDMYQQGAHKLPFFYGSVWARWALLSISLLVGSVGAQEQVKRIESKESLRASSDAMASGNSSGSRPSTHSRTASSAERHKKTLNSKSASTSPVNASGSRPMESEIAEPLAPELMEIASQIYTGRLQCELGQVVMLLPVQEMPGRFLLTLKKQKYLMTPILTPTGAVKLEDQKLGAFWIQLGNKSMLFNSKLGQRMADECQGPGQQAVAMHERISPPPSLLEPLPRVDH